VYNFDTEARVYRFRGLFDQRAYRIGSGLFVRAASSALTLPLGAQCRRAAPAGDRGFEKTPKSYLPRETAHGDLMLTLVHFPRRLKEAIGGIGLA
jgi:hypothetical protein